jgi:UDP-N-acetylmuramoylalanine--D-glutamate ligase
MHIDFSSAKFVVVGVGSTGLSIVNYLNFHQANILRVLDTRVNPPALAGYSVIGGPLEFSLVKDCDIIVISPGVSIYEPVLQLALRNNIQVIGDIELFAHAINNWGSKVIGITGSNGKTTVTSLTGFLAESAGIKTLVAGNIGTPVLEAWLEINASGNYPELIVLELSSFQLETTSNLHLASATVLNISEDHLDRYRDLLEYAYAKANIFNNCQVQILNHDDPLVVAMARNTCSHLWFGLHVGEYTLSENSGNWELQHKGNTIIAASQLQLVGRHNYLNVLASLALLDGAGYSYQLFSHALAKFAGLEHRMQKVAEFNRILYIEDSKGTNVGAVIAGVSGIERPVHLILGGDGKGQDFAPLRALVIAKCKSVAIIGQDALLIQQVLAGIDGVAIYPTLEAAVAAAKVQAKPGDAVVLSPACASWDMFTNYKHRAQVFIDTVYALHQ